ncbi:MAG: site-specific DNA-methyltransferase [Thermoprotei archaeon]
MLSRIGPKVYVNGVQTVRNYKELIITEILRNTKGSHGPMPHTLINDTKLKNIDNKIIEMIEHQASKGKDYWSFKGRSVRENAHIYYQYPAMMIPGMQRELLDIILRHQKAVLNVLDPFVGSGTTMTECMFRGLNFVGQDINPLAVLVCKAKLGPYNHKELSQSTEDILAAIKEDKSDDIDIFFPGLIKWFRADVATALSKVRRAIMKNNLLYARRFFYVALSEAVRLCSNSRTTTYKLHAREKAEIYSRRVDVVGTFMEIVSRNLTHLKKQQETLSAAGLLRNYLYSGHVDIALKDTCLEIVLPNGIEHYDLVITSPPYGDNKSTVPYGQSSFLPLQWIPLCDIDETIDPSCLKTTYEIDSRSMGGTLLVDKTKVAEIMDISPTFREVREFLLQIGQDKAQRVASFFVDLNRSLCSIRRVVRKNAYMIWTVGNRHVAGLEIPMDTILTDLFAYNGVQLIATLDRTIPSKRMPTRNSITSTMRREHILIFRAL